MVSAIRQILLVDLKFDWGPNRRRSGPYRYSYFRLEISLIVRFRVGSRFGA